MNMVTYAQISKVSDKNHSTSTALVEVTDNILCNMDKGFLTGAVYLDLKKAFDTVDYNTVEEVVIFRHKGQ